MVEKIIEFMKQRPLVIVLIAVFLLTGASGAGSAYYVNLMKEKYEKQKKELQVEHDKIISDLQKKLNEKNKLLQEIEDKIAKLKIDISKIKYSNKLPTTTKETIEILRGLGYDPKIINSVND